MFFGILLCSELTMLAWMLIHPTHFMSERNDDDMQYKRRKLLALVLLKICACFFPIWYVYLYCCAFSLLLFWCTPTDRKRVASNGTCAYYFYVTPKPRRKAKLTWLQCACNTENQSRNKKELRKVKNIFSKQKFLSKRLKRKNVPTPPSYHLSIHLIPRKLEMQTNACARKKRKT